MPRLAVSSRLLVIALLAAALTGCSLPTTDANGVATAVAATLTAAAPPAVPQATAPLGDAATPAPGMPTTDPGTAGTTTLPFPVSTFGEAEFDLQPGQSRSYVVNAAEGQVLMAYVTSAYSDGYLTIQGADNTEVLAGTYKYSTFWGYLPSTQDYTITVFAGASGGTYYLGVTLPIRLYNLSVSGAAEDGYSVSYIIGVPANQTMTVDLVVPLGSAALEIWGFNDGQGYVRRYDNWTTFHITTPISQDFLIEVYPNTGGIVDFTLIIEIQ